MKRFISATLLFVAASSPTLGQDAKDSKTPTEKSKPRFTVGKETTFVESPLGADGRPDYETAVNQILSKGVTPGNNANVLLFQAIGPTPDGVKVPAEFFKWMKADAPPEKGNYLIPWVKYCRERSLDLEKFDDQLDDAVRRAWTTADCPDLAGWLKANEKPLALAIEATKRTHYYCPLVSSRVNGKSAGLIGAPLSGVNLTREIAVALAARAMLRVSEKKYDDAWQDKTYDRISAAMGHKDRAARLKAMDEVERDVRKVKEDMFQPAEIASRILDAKSLGEAKGKFLGDNMISLFLPMIAKVQQSSDYIEQVHANLHVAFALAAYKIEQGTYPKTLDQLAPNHLAKPPIDLMTGKALVYRPADGGFLFYSVGANGKDEGGCNYDDGTPGDDIAVRLPIPVLRKKDER